MKKIITLTLTLTLTLGLMLTAQAQDELYVYRHGGVTDTLKLSEVKGISHSRVDLQGRRHDDFVLMDVTLADGSVRRFPLEWLDSVVMQRGGERYRLVRFTGSMSDDGTLRSRRGLRRTSLEGDFSVGTEDGVQFFWETGDNIFIEVDNTAKDADSVVIREGKDVASFFFKDVSVSGDSIVVYYPGQSNKGYNHVVVKAAQTQTLPNNSEHLGSAGDCGTGIATRNGNVNVNVNVNGNGSINGYEFVLDHKATYLCFLPYIANDLGRTVLEKITVRSDSAIAGEFMLDTLGIHPLRDTTHTVTLTTGKFVLPRTANQYDCSAYMVIAPQNGPTRLTCEFTVRDTVLQSTGVYTKTVDLEEVKSNMVYVVKANCNNYVVDLGLPVKFLNHNLGAFAPEEYGNYYAYAETEEKATYTSGNFMPNINNIGMEIRLTDNDAAHVKLGGNFSTPTADELRLLMDGCETWSWMTVNGKNGYLVTGPNGNKLFLPAAGYRDTENNYSNTKGYLHSSSMEPVAKNEWYFSFDSGTRDFGLDQKYFRGESIRPVVSSGVQMVDGTTIQVMTDSARWHPGGTTATLFGTLHGYDKAKTKSTLEIGFLVGNAAQVAAGEGTMASATVTGDGRYSAVFTMPKDTAYYYRACVRERNGRTNLANTLQFGRAYADLGLPSGNLWSSVNIGCTQPEDKGDYYAWGETVTKATYTKSNHRWYQDQTFVFPEGCLRDIHATCYDVAAVEWGGTWVTPNKADLQELIKYCDVDPNATVNGMPGFRFTSKVEGYTDRSIFIPKTGWMSTAFNHYRTYSYLITSEMADNENRHGYGLENGSLYDTWNHYNGLAVRPVNKRNATSTGGNRMYIRTMPAVKHYDGVAPETDTLKAIIRGYTGDGTIAGIAWWPENGTPETVTRVPLIPDANGYVKTVIGDDPNNPLTPCNTYYYAGYVDDGTKIYYGDTLYIDAIGLVDLGLSVKWANVNMGAQNEAASGEFYRWGATEPYRKQVQEYTANKDITPESGRDICTNTWGSTFRMPTKAEGDELTNPANCRWTWETHADGTTGYRVTSLKAGYENSSIFIPAAGYFMNDDEYHNFKNYWSDYWCSTCHSAANGYQMGFNNEVSSIGGLDYNNPKKYGFTVRAVQYQKDHVQTIGMRRSVRDRAEVDTLVSYLTLLSGRSLESGFILHTDSTNLTAANSSVRILPLETVVAGENKLAVTGLTPGQTYYYRAYIKYDEVYIYDNVKKFELIEDVDLGLSVMWTNVNVGADYAEDCGDYYAWGETAPKNIYSQDTYTYYQNGTWIELGSDIGGTQYDAASVNMGLRWRMPTQAQCQELLDNTTAKDTLVNGVKCWKLTSTKTGYTDRYIILPRYSQMKKDSLSDNSGQGIYASSTRYDDDEAYYLYLSDGNSNQNSSGYRYSKCWGKTVRAVVQKNTGDLGNGVYAHVATDGCDWEIGSTTATLRGHAALSEPVEGATRGFVVGTIKEVDTPTPDDGNIVTVAGTADAFTYDYTYQGGARYFRTFLKVGSTYYLGDVKAVTAADLLDVEFNGSNQAFHGTVSAIPVSKVGSSTCLYSDDYERYMANLSDNSAAAGSVSNYYRFDYGSATDFNQKLLNGHTLEVFVKPGGITSGWSDMIASYQNGGDGLSIYDNKFCYCPYLSGYQYYYAENTLPTTDKYYHFVGVWDKANQQVRVYVDGALDNTYNNVPASMTATDISHYIVGGAPSSGSSADEAFKGIIGFARIYSAALTDEQVQALYDTIKENKNTGE